MRVRCFFIVALLVSFQAVGGHTSASRAVNEWAARASENNLAGASQAELLSCMKSLRTQVDVIGRDGPFPARATSYVALVSWGVGWMSMTLSYAAVDDRGNGLLVSDDGESDARRKVPGADVRALVSRLSRLQERYSVAPGVMDGGCELLVISGRMGVRSVLLPPGTQVFSDEGDPRDMIRAWQDEHLPASR